MGLISKKEPLHVQHTFFGHFFAVVLHGYNVKLPETFLWRKCRTCSRSLFFTGAQFLLTFVAASISHFITAATKFRYTFWVAIPINRVILHWYACGTDGRAYCHVITKFSRIGRFFFPMGLRSSLRARAPLKSRNYRKSGILGNRVSMDIFKWKCQNRFVAYKTLNCKTVRVFAYSSTRE